MVEFCLLPNLHAEIQTPKISECDFIWRQGPYRGNRVKMKSLEGALTQYDYCLIKRRNSDTKTHIKEDYGKKEREKMATHVPRTETWEQPLPRSPQKEPTWLTPWFWTPSLQSCEAVTFCCISHSVWDTCYSCLSKLIHTDSSSDFLWAQALPWAFYTYRPMDSPQQPFKVNADIASHLQMRRWQLREV